MALNASDDLLERFRPVVFADSKDRFLEGVAMHGAETHGWAQFWLAWPGDRDHAGVDWEMVMFRPTGLWPVAVYAAHRGAEARLLQRVRRLDGRPVVYATRDKHASRYRPGWHRHGLHLERADGRRRLDLPLQIGVPAAVQGRLAYRDPDRWLTRLGVCADD